MCNLPHSLLAYYLLSRSLIHSQLTCFHLFFSSHSPDEFSSSGSHMEDRTLVIRADSTGSDVSSTSFLLPGQADQLRIGAARQSFAFLPPVCSH